MDKSPLVWAADWSERPWLTCRQVADEITQIDAFWDTRMILAQTEKLPKAVEAIAAYPSERAWRRETVLLAEQPNELPASDAPADTGLPSASAGSGRPRPACSAEDAADLARDPTSASSATRSTSGYAATCPPFSVQICLCES